MTSYVFSGFFSGGRESCGVVLSVGNVVVVELSCCVVIV